MCGGGGGGRFLEAKNQPRHRGPSAHQGLPQHLTEPCTILHNDAGGTFTCRPSIPSCTSCMTHPRRREGESR